MSGRAGTQQVSRSCDGAETKFEGLMGGRDLGGACVHITDIWDCMLISTTKEKLMSIDGLYMLKRTLRGEYVWWVGDDGFAC